jgi:hypothetical protein
MEAIQKFSAGQLNQATFECQLLGAFFAAASSYMVMGTMLGYRCRRQAARPPRGKKCWKK